MWTWIYDMNMKAIYEGMKMCPLIYAPSTACNVQI